MSVNDLINYSFGAMLYVCFPLREVKKVKVYLSKDPPTEGDWADT